MGKRSRIIYVIEGKTARPNKVISEEPVNVSPWARREFLCAGLERADLPCAIWRIVIVSFVKK